MLSFRGSVIKINQLFLAVCYAPGKGMTDNRFGISEVIVQQNLFFSSGIQSFFSSNFVHDKLFSGRINKSLSNGLSGVS